MKNESYNRFLYFLHKYNLFDEDSFTYIMSRVTFIKGNIKSREVMGTIGLYDSTKNGKLESFQLCLPEFNCPEAELVNINFYVTALERYHILGKRLKKEPSMRIIPMLYEKIYLQEYPIESLKAYSKYLDSKVTEVSDETFRLGLATQQEMLEYYNNEHPNSKELSKKAKKLTKQYHKNLK